MQNLPKSKTQKVGKHAQILQQKAGCSPERRLHSWLGLPGRGSWKCREVSADKLQNVAQPGGGSGRSFVS